MDKSMCRYTTATPCFRNQLDGDNKIVVILVCCRLVTQILEVASWLAMDPLHFPESQQQRSGDA